ncbi:phosphopantetheine-binding protein, partial [Streptomyces sp. NPDC050428]|uniref:phosphopantetheine-binding protein n=1 Tax=Streptomyces sp. NPDC050428 TaxID=3155757 RepID=UPI003440D6F3
VQSLHRRVGVGGMDPAVAVTALEHALDEGYLAVADVDWGRVLELGAGGGAWLTDLPDAQASVADRADQDSSWVKGLRGASAGRRASMALAMVREQAAVVLGHAGAGRVAEGAAFRSLGFDSLTAVELRNRLATVTGLSLPAGLVFDHPTPAALSEHLLGELVQGEPAEELPLLAQFDTLQSRLAALDADSELRTTLVARIRGLAASLEKTHGNGTSALAEKLNIADRDEILEFIENDLGLS